MRWRVENSIGANGLPVDAWAEAARRRLLDESAVEHLAVAAFREPHDVELTHELTGLSVDVVVRGPDPRSAAALVEHVVTAALGDIVDDDEVGWTAYEWEAVPADDD